MNGARVLLGSEGVVFLAGFVCVCVFHLVGWVLWVLVWFGFGRWLKPGAVKHTVYHVVFSQSVC